MKHTFLLVLLLACCAITFAQPARNNKQAEDYKNPKLPTSKRIADLLSRMTLEEKVGQLRSLFAANPKVNDALFNNPQKMDSLFGKGIAMINPDFDNTLEQS